MAKPISEKIILLNKIAQDSLSQADLAVIVKNFALAGKKILEADFSLAWLQTQGKEQFELIYKSTGAPAGFEFALSALDVKTHKTLKPTAKIKPHQITIPVLVSGDRRGQIVLGYKNQGKLTLENKSLLELLSTSLAQVLTITRLQTVLNERKQTETSITKMAYTDHLTGIPNRALLNERLEEEHTLAKIKKGMYALFFIDLDRFKIINDIYGHESGDILLKQVAQRLRKAIPKKATLARMGGDEFLILLPALASVADAEKCAKLIQNTFTEFFTINDQEIYCNGSIGFAIFPLDGVDYHVVMKHADLALHRAKEHGGGTAQQYRLGQPLFYTMQPKLQSQLRQALKRGELMLQYQPILNVRNKHISGIEALVRWNHPEMGLIYPRDFVGQAEESGLIIEIGEWVIHEVCRQIQDWEKQGRIPPPVSINVSPRELLRPTLVGNIDKALKEFKISPSQIKLELTETFLMKNIDLSISILEQLKALGLRILIDDFGTGYASLNYLKRLPIDAVKIDRTFIAGIPVSLQDAALTSAIIAISHQLGLEVVAEGVENLDQFEFLRAAQCNYVQGNFFFNAVNAEQMADLLHLARPSNNRPSNRRKTSLSP